MIVISMKINIQSLAFHASDPQIELVENKINELNCYIEMIMEAQGDFKGW